MKMMETRGLKRKREDEKNAVRETLLSFAKNNDGKDDEHNRAKFKSAQNQTSELRAEFMCLLAKNSSREMQEFGLSICKADLGFFKGEDDRASFLEILNESQYPEVRKQAEELSEPEEERAAQREKNKNLLFEFAQDNAGTNEEEFHEKWREVQKLNSKERALYLHTLANNPNPKMQEYARKIFRERPNVEGQQGGFLLSKILERRASKELGKELQELHDKDPKMYQRYVDRIIDSALAHPTLENLKIMNSILGHAQDMALNGRNGIPDSDWSRHLKRLAQCKDQSFQLASLHFSSKRFESQKEFAESHKDIMLLLQASSHNTVRESARNCARTFYQRKTRVTQPPERGR